MIIASHRRSGTHLLIESLRRSFGRKLLLLKTHGLAGEVFDQSARVENGTSVSLDLLDRYDAQHMLYIVRDPRDTLTSNFHWWQSSGESKRGGIAPYFQDITPRAWINGEVRIKQVPDPHPGCGVTQAHIDDYRNLLEPQTVAAIEDRAGPLMQRLGYLPAPGGHTGKNSNLLILNR